MAAMVFITVILTSNETQRMQEAALALWPAEISKGRLSRSEIVRRFTCAGAQLLAPLSEAERRVLETEFAASTSHPNGFHFRGRLPRG